MGHNDFDQKIDRFTRGIVRRKINQLVGRAGFTRQDGDDVQQDLFLRVLQSLPLFNSNQGHRNKFITAVVERHVANILRNKQADKRDHRRIFAGFISREFGADAFEAERVNELPQQHHQEVRT